MPPTPAAAPAPARLASACSRTGGRTTSDTRGNQRSRCNAPMRENLLRSSPSIRTGSTKASALSATRPAPSYTFISPPVRVMRPSGKITSRTPRWTAWTISRAAYGLVGSTVSTGTGVRNGRTHHFCAM